MTTDREDFEHAYEPNPHKSPFTEVKFDEQGQVYKPLDKFMPRIASALNSAWYGWRIRQSKMDELQSNYNHLLGKYRATKQLQYSTSEHNSRLHRTLLFVKDHFWMNDLDKAMPRVFEEITECLDDKPRKVHNTSCTYQFELAFLHLQDTPELRKMYWSALGQLKFDSNDQVIPPELEECPCCKQPIIRKIGTETEGYETFDIGVDESGSRYIRYRHGEWELEE